jgi:tRNA (guanine-N7-)-methyltransferase
VRLHGIEDLAEILARIPPASRLEVEIGCGNGHFITQYAEEVPSSFLLGIEMKKKRGLKAVKKAERRGLDNVAIVQGKAEELIARLPPSSVGAYHVYFPDPWPKTRHRRRRFFRKPNLDLLAAGMQPGGLIHFASDVSDYCLQAKILLILHPAFELSPRPPRQEVFLSVFGRKFLEMGKEIYSVTGVRRPTDPRQPRGRGQAGGPPASADQVDERHQDGEQIHRQGGEDQQSGHELKGLGPPVARLREA